MALRRRESDWWSVTAGNGAIYGLRADLWPRLRTAHGHDLSLPHQVVRLGCSFRNQIIELFEHKTE